MTAAAALTRLLAGPPSQAGAEHLDEHRARLGELPPAGDRREIVAVLEASGLLGRGGAAFPVGRKWRAVAERSADDAVVVVNGAEGEPRSAKDRVLMSCRPHLVLDGAVVAADAVGANEIVLYVGSEHRNANRALGRALAEREPAVRARTRIVAAPVGYVAGEATAAVHFLNAGDARPTFLETARTRPVSVAGPPSSRTWRASPTLRSSHATAMRGTGRPAAARRAEPRW